MTEAQQKRYNELYETAHATMKIVADNEPHSGPVTRSESQKAHSQKAREMLSRQVKAIYAARAAGVEWGARVEGEGGGW